MAGILEPGVSQAPTIPSTAPSASRTGLPAETAGSAGLNLTEVCARPVISTIAATGSFSFSSVKAKAFSPTFAEDEDEVLRALREPVGRETTAQSDERLQPARESVRTSEPSAKT